MTPQEVRRWRTEHGLTQAALAEHLKVSTLTIKRWEGGHQPTPRQLPMLLDWLHGQLRARSRPAS